MTLDPILTAPTVIQIHVAAAVFALMIGPFSIWRKRRDRIHKTLGYIWISSMFMLATSAWFINEIRLIGPFSPIHGFSLLTYYGLWEAISHVRARRFEAHGKTMKNLYFLALGVTGLFTLLPGRRMNDVLFGSYEATGFAASAIAAVAVFVWLRFRRSQTA